MTTAAPPPDSPRLEATYAEADKTNDDTKLSSDTSRDIEKGSGDDAPATTETDRFFVEFHGPNDPNCPKSWTASRRWAITVSMSLMVFTVTFASSIFSVNLVVVQEKFNVKLITATLGVALFVLVCQISPTYTCYLPSIAVTN